jgi:bacteriorhodopsin
MKIGLLMIYGGAISLGVVTALAGHSIFSWQYWAILGCAALWVLGTAILGIKASE